MNEQIATRAEVEAELARATEYARRLTLCLEQLPMPVARTDYVTVQFPREQRAHTYLIAGQPKQRRVQAGDLVTVPAVRTWDSPRILRVTEVNVLPPIIANIKTCVAISPEDARRIEAVVGKVR